MKLSPLQPESVPLTFRVWIFATFVRPGESVTEPDAPRIVFCYAATHGAVRGSEIPEW